MKRRWLVSLLLAAVAVVAVGGVVAADTADPPATDEPEVSSTPAPLIEKLADKLGLDADALDETVREAIEELSAERDAARVDAFIDALLEQGRVTEDEADELRAWYGARPAVLDTLPGVLGRRGCFGFGDGRGTFGFHFRFRSDEGSIEIAPPESFKGFEWFLPRNGRGHFERLLPRGLFEFHFPPAEDQKSEPAEDTSGEAA